MQRSLNALLVVIIFCTNLVYAQSFTFSDTYHTDKVDSLENWLKTHPQPTQERLKNLIRLNRCYILMYPDKKNRDTTHIRQLAQRLNHPLGKSLAAVWTKPDFKKDLQFLDVCEALKDTSGMIYALTRLAIINYTLTIEDIGDQYAAQDYLRRAKQLLKARFNMHDFIVVESATYKYHALKPDTNQDSLLQSYQNTLKLIESHPQYKYALVAFKGYIAILHYYRGEYAASYVINKEILTQLKPDQFYETLKYTQNLINDCGYLNRYDEKLALCQKLSTLIRMFPQTDFPYDYLNLYNSFKQELSRRGRYREAMLYGDSMLSINDMIYNIERNQKLIEFQAENKQKQIAELTLEQIQTQNRNRFILTLLGIALLVAAALSYLGWRLTHANTQLRQLTHARDQLFGLVAHDLRRPLFAFQNMSQLIHFYLRKKDYDAIEEVSANINESGIKLQQTLDNLVAWAMSQGEALPYQPTDVVLLKEVNDMIELYKSVYVFKKATFDVAIPPTLMAYADLNGLRVIVRNLIDNSSKALPDGGHLHIAGQQLDNAEVELTFTDDAGGLSSSLLAVIERVFAAPHKAQIGADGLGMGLVMVARFVQRNGGSISVQRHEGKGTTFKVRLPAQKRS